MENKETATRSPLGFCEKLFNALHLNPTFRSLRRLSYHQEEPVAVVAAVPPPPPLVPNSVGAAPAAPTKRSGLEHPVGAAGGSHQSGVSGKNPLEVRPSRIEPERMSVPLKAPSKVAATPSKNLTQIGPQAPPTSRLPTETGRASSTPVKGPAPTLTPAPASEKEVSKLDDVKTSVVDAKPAAAETDRTQTRKNLNEKVDEYINRTRNRVRTRSNVGSSSSKG